MKLRLCRPDNSHKQAHYWDQDTDEAVAAHTPGFTEEALCPRHTHNCSDHAVPYSSNGALGHGWECGLCGKFLQAG